MEKINGVLNNIYTKILAFAVTAILTLTGMLYKDTRDKIDMLEGRVAVLFQDKVSRAEFKEELNQLRLQNESNKIDIINRQESVKNDILARIDFIMSGVLKSINK